jgi:serine/threonine-protein kinase
VGGWDDHAEVDFPSMADQLDRPPRVAAALADRYRIERELGQGGMATVYLAHDLRHDRQVALKVLKPELAAVLGAERFVVEIKTTAALQHPHILPLFDSGTADGFLYYVMPYIQGETLRSKLDRETQLGIEEAVKLTTAVADALDYAHRHGVIHRDIKPENILLHDGRPMVADFGIALAVSAAAGGRMTETGLSLGTPHYMSPEQATAEKELTGRSDLYSLGCVLYEMLTGSPPHVGATAQQIIMKIVTDTARPVTELRKSVPPHVAAAVGKALEKLPADRFGSAAEFAAALANPGFAPAATAASFAGTRRSLWNPLSIGASAAAVVALLGVVWMALQREPVPAVRRLALMLAPGQALANAVNRLALSPDGSGFVYSGQDATGQGKLMLRRFDQLAAVALPGTEGATSPVFAPDGSRIAFLSTPFAVKVVATNGAPAITVVDERVIGGGLAWSADDWIYFDAGTSLDRIRPGGDGREVVVPLDTTIAEVGFAWPEPLPDGKGLLYRSRRANETIHEYVIKAMDLTSGARKTLVRGLIARYLPTGHLLYVTAGGVLLVAPFDPARMELTGAGTPVVEGLGLSGFGSVDLAVSPVGDLLYLSNASTGGDRFSWVRRDGTAEVLDPEWDIISESVLDWRLSPDGRRLAVAVGGGGPNPSDIWVKELDRGPASKLTFAGINSSPVWLGNSHLLYVSASPTDPNLIGKVYRIRADGTGSPEPVLKDSRGVALITISPRDGWVVAGTQSQAAAGDLFAFRLDQDSLLTPLLNSPAAESHPALSPDGRWLAYTSNESGRLEVYVRPFPNIAQGEWQISLGGGVSPRWRSDGAELFYNDLGLNFMAAEIRTTPVFSVGRRQVLHGLGLRPGYDPAPDGQRTLRLWRQGVNDSLRAQLVLVEGFLSSLDAVTRK